MGTRVLAVNNYMSGECDNDESNNNNVNTFSSINNNADDGNGDVNIRSVDSFIDESNLDEVKDCCQIDGISDDNRGTGRDGVMEQDEGSDNGDFFDETYKSTIHISNVHVEDDQSSLESSGSLRNSFNVITAKDLMPIETARARFLQIVVDSFINEHTVMKQGASFDNIVGDDKSNKRKSAEVEYEGDPRFVLPLMYVANLYETLVGEVNMRIAAVHGLRERTIGVALEASGGLYRKLAQKFPKTGSYSFKRRELATSLETRTKFPELVVREEKRVRFVVANGLEIVERPNNVPAIDAEWFKLLTGRTEVAITAKDYKLYNPRHKVRRSSTNTSPSVPGLLSYSGNGDQEFQSETKSPRVHETPIKNSSVMAAREPQYQRDHHHHHSVNHCQQTIPGACNHDSGQSSFLPDIAHDHGSPSFSQNMASLEPLGGSHVVGRLNAMPISPAKFCDECGSPYLRPTSKFCSQCGTKRFGYP